VVVEGEVQVVSARGGVKMMMPIGNRDYSPSSRLLGWVCVLCEDGQVTTRKTAISSTATRSALNMWCTAGTRSASLTRSAPHI
jgi:hypothetical protein